MTKKGESKAKGNCSEKSKKQVEETQATTVKDSDENQNNDTKKKGSESGNETRFCGTISIHVYTQRERERFRLQEAGKLGAMRYPGVSLLRLCLSRVWGLIAFGTIG